MKKTFLKLSLWLTLITFISSPLSVFATGATSDWGTDTYTLPTAAQTSQTQMDAFSSNQAAQALPTEAETQQTMMDAFSSNQAADAALQASLPTEAETQSFLQSAELNPSSGGDPTASAANSLTSASYNGGGAGASGSATNLGSAAGGCIGKIVGTYVANYLGIGITAAINAISHVFSKTASTERTTAGTTQTTALVTSIPVQNSVQYLQQDAALSLQEDARAHNGAVDAKQNFITPMAICIANELVQQVGKATIQWINNGFKNPDGTTGPAFMSDPKSFFTGIADREVGGFLKSLGPVGSMLCKPFDVKVRLALLNDYRQGYGQQAQCSIASIQKNFSNFGKGKNGGNGNYWGDWFKLTQQDNNNPIGSYYLAKQQMDSSIKYNQDVNKLEVTLGSGFLAMKTCTAYKPGTKVCDKWKNTTPGKEVQASLDRVLTIQGQRINIADSLDGVIQALVGQLLKMAVGGLQGQK